MTAQDKDTPNVTSLPAAKEAAQPAPSAPPENPAKGPKKLAVVAGNAISARLRDAGLDPSQLTRRTSPATVVVKARARHRLMGVTFVLGVLLPSLFATLYMAFIAADQFHSRTAFAVRSVENTGTTELLGMVMQGGGATNSSDSYIINDYLQSQAIIDDVSKTVDLERIFNASQADWLFRMGADLPIEDRLDYWNSMVDVNYDSTSGNLFVQVKAFAPGDAKAIAEAIVENSDALVNRLSETAQRETIRFAKEEVARSEARLKVFRKQLLDYREATQEINPAENAKITLELIATLEQELTKNEAELKTIRDYLDEQSPKVIILKRQIASLREQIAAERKRLGEGSEKTDTVAGSERTISNRIASYEGLELEREFAERLYTASLASLEKARAEAEEKQTYLAVFLAPTLSEDAQYPHRALSSLAIFLGLLGLWLVGVMTYYNIRDRS